jgi:hypothetical protein
MKFFIFAHSICFDFFLVGRRWRVSCASRVGRAGTTRLSDVRVVHGPGSRHGVLARHSTTNLSCRSVSCQVVSCLGVLVPCRVVRPSWTSVSTGGHRRHSGRCAAAPMPHLPRGYTISKSSSTSRPIIRPTPATTRWGFQSRACPSSNSTTTTSPLLGRFVAGGKPLSNPSRLQLPHIELDLADPSSVQLRPPITGDLKFGIRPNSSPLGPPHRRRPD